MWHPRVVKVKKSEYSCQHHHFEPYGIVQKMYFVDVVKGLVVGLVMGVVVDAPKVDAPKGFVLVVVPNGDVVCGVVVVTGAGGDDGEPNGLVARAKGFVPVGVVPKGFAVGAAVVPKGFDVAVDTVPNGLPEGRCGVEANGLAAGAMGVVVAVVRCVAKNVDKRFALSGVTTPR